jgi:branched-chain amino acid transport system substrate-binding protein
VSFRKGVARRGFLTVAVSSIVAGVGAYYAGTLAAPVKEVVKEVARTVTSTTLAPEAPYTTTVSATAPPTTVTKTVTAATPTLAGQVVKIGEVLPLAGAASTLGAQERRGYN